MTSTTSEKTSDMAGQLPPDFPGYAAAAMNKINSVSPTVYRYLLEFITNYWGDVGAISAASKVWEKEGKRAGQSNSDLDASHRKLTNPDTVNFWKGDAREAYVAWRDDFKSNTLDKYQQGIWDIKAALDSIIGTMNSIRGHIVAVVIEVAGAIAGAMTDNPVGLGASAVFLLSVAGTLADLAIRVRSDLDGHGRTLETYRQQHKLDRGGGVVSLPFKTDIICDWDNWQHAHPKMAN
jgi:hypothetical protein